MIKLNNNEVVGFLNNDERVSIIKRILFSPTVLDVARVVLYYTDGEYFVLKNRYKNNMFYMKLLDYGQGESVKWDEVEFLVLDKASRQLMEMLIKEHVNPYHKAGCIMRELYSQKYIIITDDYLRV